MWSLLGTAATMLLPRSWMDPNWVPGLPQLLRVGDDFAFFAEQGQKFWTGGAAAVYDQVGNQAGLLQCLASDLIQRWLIVPLGYQSVAGAVCFLVLLVATCLTVLLTDRLAPGSVTTRGMRWAVPGVVTGYLLLLGTPSTVVGWGHWWQLPVLLAWMLVIAAASRPGLPTVGLVGVVSALVIATGFEPWALLGLPLLLLIPDRRRMLLAGAAAATGAGLFLLPVMTGSAASQQWPILAHSLWSVLGFSTFTWQQRFAQGAVVVLVVMLATRLLRRGPSPEALVWLPALVVATRVALEPWWLPYYFSAVQVLLVGFAGAAAAVRQWRRVGLAVAGVVISSTQSAFVPVFWTGVLLAVVAVTALWAPHRSAG